MTLWFTADTHFGHKKIIEHSKRPFLSVEEMNEVLVHNWNACVAPNDTVWHLGDIEFRGKDQDAAYWLRQLNGHIHVCIGNHDDPKVLAQSRAASVQDVKYLRHEGQKLWLSHYAHRTWRNSHHGSIHLFGHSHGDLGWLPGRLMDVGVDSVALLAGGGAAFYRPVSFDEIVTLLGDAPVTDQHGQ